MTLEHREQALYQVLPQTAADGNCVHSGIDGDDIDERDITGPSPAALVDAPVRLVHFILGCSVLLPWNVFMTATPYFLSRLNGSPYKQTFISYLSIACTVSNFIFLVHATAVSGKWSPSRQTHTMIIGLAFLSLLLTLSTFVHVVPGVFFVFVINNGILQAALGSYFATSTIAVASLFGPVAVQSMMSGQAAVAVAVSGIQVANTALFLNGATPEVLAANATTGSAEEQAAFAFFTVATIFLVITAFANQWLVDMPAYKILVAPLEGRKTTERSSTEERQGLTSSGPSASLDRRAHILRVAKANAVYEIAVGYVFAVTNAVFPPITTLVQPTNPKFHPLLFSAVHFLVFNLGDWFGRYLCAFPQLLIWSARRLMGFSLARTLFVPVFLTCNIQLPSLSTSLPSSALVRSDFFFFFVLFLFGTSNGYVQSLCLMAAPSLEHNPRLKGRKEDVDVAATVANFFLVGGLVLGSLGSFAVRAIVCRCNPFID